MIDCVIKTLKNKKKKIVWQALYKNGKKEIEDSFLDIKLANKIFNNSKNWKEIQLVEDVVYFDHKEKYFPDFEDFSYLLDYKDINIGSTVWLENGKFTVKEIWDSFREEGEYYYNEWYDTEKLLYKKEKMFYEAHPIKKFKVCGDEKEYVWEDYNYQQSFLYLKNKKSK